MDTYICINADADIDISTDLYTYSSQHSTFPLGCAPISGQLQCANFHANGYAKMQRSRATIPEHVREMKTMNRGVEQNKQSETIARASIWEGKAIMGTDGYSFVISIS
jgi:hypothetical protein